MGRRRTNQTSSARQRRKSCEVRPHEAQEVKNALRVLELQRRGMRDRAAVWLAAVVLTGARTGEAMSNVRRQVSPIVPWTLERSPPSTNLAYVTKMKKEGDES